MERTVTGTVGTAARAALTLVLFLAVGCSNGSDTPPGTTAPAGGTSLSGWWLIEIGVAFGALPPDFITLPGNALQQGSNFWYCGEMGVISGSTITFSDPEAVVPMLTVVNDNRLEGMGTENDPVAGTITTTVVMTRPATAPGGTLSVTGMANGQPVAVSSTQAAGLYEVVDPDDCSPPCPTGSAGVSAIDCSDGMNVYTVEIRVLDGAPTLGTPYQIGPDAELDFFSVSVDAFAVSGTFTLTRADSAVGGRIMGTFDVVLDTGGSIQGAFDVPVSDVRQP
ncbi:MAG: hypothetical protein ACYTG3_12735 [Planctomycetota bacterium]|jgi:hypothetical protein